MEPKMYGECRCCRAKGRHKDITKEYYYNDSREIFIDSFIECFNLFLSTNKQLTTLICAVCVNRLRDACCFRKMVADTEKNFLAAIAENDDKHTVFVHVPADKCIQETELDIKTEEVNDVKEEPAERQEDDIDFEMEYDLPSDQADYDTRSSKEDESLVEGEAELLERFRRKSLPPLPNRNSLRKTCPNYVKHLDLLKGILVVPKMLSKLLKETQNIDYRRTKVSGNVYITEKVAQVTNAAILLENSNITPFKSRGRKGFLCFYCPNIFEDATKLRSHTLEHDKTEINQILKLYVPESLVINADITELKCTICDESIPKLNELKSHLIKVHKKVFYTEFTDRIIPYKLTDSNVCDCQICECSFVTYGAIERHMNVHFRNYICKECGAGFVTNARLKVHHSNTHLSGAFPCEICGKMYATQLKLKNHSDHVHKSVKRFRCNKCPERFTEYIYRQKHLEDVHGVPPIEYKCRVCDKTFSRKYNLSTHMKRDHLEEREHQCDMCTYRCFSSKQLSMHMVKHSGERIYECSVCKKSYARKKTLSEHMKIHNNDRRFACSVCGQAFVQKCSLKGHMKTHHVEYSL